MHFPYVDEDSPALITVQDGGMRPEGPASSPAPEAGQLALPHLQLGNKGPVEEEGDHEDDSDRHSNDSWEMVPKDGSPRAGEDNKLQAALEAAPPETPTAAEAEPQQAAVAAADPAGAASPVPPEEAEPTSPHSDTSDNAAHELYSMSQEGSIDGYSDTDSHLTDALMAQGEPDHVRGASDAEGGDEHGAAQGAAAEGAGVPKGLYAAITQELAGITSRVQAYAAAGRMAAEDMGTFVWNAVQEWLGTVQARLYRAAAPPLRLLGEELADAGHRVRLALDRVVKQAPYKRVDWMKVTLGAGCVALAAICYRLHHTNQKLTLRLALREAEMAELLSRIMSIRQNYNRSSHVPIIRPTTCAMASWTHLMNAV